MEKPNTSKEKPKEQAKLSEHFFRELQIEFLIHEMKDPFSVIETGTRTLLEKKDRFGALSSRQEKTLLRILRNARKVQGMLNDLLEIGRSEAGCFICCKFSPADALYDILMDTLEAIGGSAFEPRVKHKGHDQCIKCLSNFGVHLDIAPTLFDLEMYQDKVKFNQIVGNLIKNALYHRNKKLEIRMTGKKELLFIDVTDDGPGIEPAHHEMIFQRYTRIKDPTTLNRKGHGLGLAGALISARSIGGNIEIKSDTGAGSTFRLILPIIFREGDHQGALTKRK